jgi:hypothetical protein
MSMAGGWFFLMACEMFVLGNRDLRLPGLGSYLQTAANAGDTRARREGRCDCAYGPVDLAAGYRLGGKIQIRASRSSRVAPLSRAGFPARFEDSAACCAGLGPAHGGALGPVLCQPPAEETRRQPPGKYQEMDCTRSSHRPAARARICLRSDDGAGCHGHQDGGSQYFCRSKARRFFAWNSPCSWQRFGQFPPE